MKTKLLTASFLLATLFVKAQDNFPGLNMRRTQYAGNYSGNNYGCGGQALPHNVFLPGISGTNSNNFTFPNDFNPTTNINTPAMYSTSPNSGAFYDVPVNTLGVQSGEPLPMANSLQTAWYTLENPNLKNIAYRIYTANDKLLSSVPTGIAIYKYTGTGTATVNSPYLVEIAYIAPNTQAAIDLQAASPSTSLIKDMANGLSIGFTFDNTVWPGGAIPKPLIYETTGGAEMDWNNGAGTCGTPFTTNELALMDITQPLTLLNLMSDAASGGNGTYCELYNPSPNTTYYIQILVSPNPKYGTPCSPVKDSGYYTLSITADLLSGSSYTASDSTIDGANPPVFLTPLATYYTNSSGTPYGITYDAERPIYKFTGSSPSFVPSRTDPGAGSNNGYAFWSNSATNVLSNTADLYLPSNNHSNPLTSSNFGSSIAGGWSTGTTYERGYTYGFGNGSGSAANYDNNENNGQTYSSYGGLSDAGYSIDYTMEFASPLGVGNMFFTTYSIRSYFTSSTIADMPTNWYYPTNPPTPSVAKIKITPQTENVNTGVFNIFPNPNNGGDVSVKYNFTQPCSEVNLNVYALDGNLIYSTKFASNLNTQGEQHFSLSSLANGSYIVEVKCDQGVARKQVIIAK